MIEFVLITSVDNDYHLQTIRRFEVSVIFSDSIYSDIKGNFVNSSFITFYC